MSDGDNMKPEIYIGSRRRRPALINWNVAVKRLVILACVIIAVRWFYDIWAIAHERRELRRLIEIVKQTECSSSFYNNRIDIALSPDPITVAVGKDKELTITVPQIDRTQMISLITSFIASEKTQRQMMAALEQSPKLTLVLTTGRK